MSRYAVESTAYEIVVGWDAPLVTYFAQVFSLPSEESEEDKEPIFWIGCTTREIQTVEDLEKCLQTLGYCQLSQELKQNLVSDKEAEPFTERPKALADLIRLFEENILEE